MKRRDVWGQHTLSVRLVDLRIDKRIETSGCAATFGTMAVRLVDLRIDERIETTINSPGCIVIDERLIDLRIDERIETFERVPRVDRVHGLIDLRIDERIETEKARDAIRLIDLRTRGLKHEMAEKWSARRSMDRRED